ncbi:MAG: hypothetical protein ACI87E_003504 [Mariniblastus sp.]|jgi:hypothetical protein
MIKKNSLNVLFMVRALALAIAVASLPTLVAAQPNILFISVDDINNWGIPATPMLRPAPMWSHWASPITTALAVT